MQKRLIFIVFIIICTCGSTISSQSSCIDDQKRGMLVKFHELSSIEGIWISSQSYVYKYVNGQLMKKDVLTGSTTFDYMILLQNDGKFYMIKTDDCQLAVGFRGYAIFRPTSDPNVYIGQSPTQTFNVYLAGNKLTYKVREDYKNIKKDFGKRTADMMEIEFELNLIKAFPTEKDYQKFIEQDMK